MNDYLLKRLERNLGQVANVFPDVYGAVTEGRTCADSEIHEYYEGSVFGYKLFHSFSGAVHMAISSDGNFRRSDFMAQVQGIAEQIRAPEQTTLRVLEVGCGQGYNLHHLALSYPHHKYIGVDITESHLRYARRMCRRQPNVLFINADCTDLPESVYDIDMCFAVEALCHVRNIAEFSNTLAKISQREGKLIVYDGFRDNTTRQDEKLDLAGRLVEYSMAVPRFHDVSDFRNALFYAGFIEIEAENLSMNIMPNLMRLRSLAKAYYKAPILSRAIRELMGTPLTQNSVAGLLMPVVVQQRMFTYQKIIFQKG